MSYIREINQYAKTQSRQTIPHWFQANKHVLQQTWGKKKSLESIKHFQLG